MANHEIWHDEYKCPETGAYVHGVLAIPASKKEQIVRLLKDIRSAHDYGENEKRGYGGSLSSSKRAEFLRNILTVGVHVLRVKPDTLTPLYRAYNLKKTSGRKPFTSIPGDPFGAKFGMLVIPQNHADMIGEDYATKVETTLRFGLKGLCHWAFEDERPINITHIYFDGVEHHGRDYSLTKIIGSSDWRRYVTIDLAQLQIDNRHRDERTDETALIMDFVDALVGGLFNTTYRQVADEYKALLPLAPLVDRLRDGHTKVQKNSRWFKAVSVSEVYLSGNKECPFEFRDLAIEVKENQLTLGL